MDTPFDAAGARADADIRRRCLQRDDHGNALGGVRLAENGGAGRQRVGALCGLGGTHVPFDAATLDRLYPRTRITWPGSRPPRTLS